MKCNFEAKACYEGLENQEKDCCNQQNCCDECGYEDCSEGCSIFEETGTCASCEFAMTDDVFRENSLLKIIKQ